jgi:hypothetical protein
MDTLGEAGYAEVATLDDGGGSYDWSELHVYTKGERVFVNVQRGCSCYSWEEPGESELIEVPSLESARSQWEDMMGSYASDDKWLDARPTFANLGLR